MPVLLIALALLQEPPCRGEAARHEEQALRLGEAFDLNGAAEAYTAAANAGCARAQARAIYIRGLVAARAADAQFGSAASLLPLKQALTALEPHAAADPVVRIMQAVLRAAMPAAQHEQPEIALLIEQMLRMESVQLEAGFEGLPVLSAHEAAGYFWLQLHVYDEAARAFDVAARRIGRTPHVRVGVARTAAGRGDRMAACEEYAQLIAWWAGRPATPPEIGEARAYLKGPSCARPPDRPAPRR